MMEMNKNILEEQEIELSITGKGSSIETTYANIFKQLREQVYSEIGGYLIQMNVKEFQIKEYEAEKKIKKFLFFFMPQETTVYTIVASIRLKVVIIKDIFK